MPLQTLNVNQFAPTQIIGAVSALFNPNVLPVRTNPASAQPTFPSGTVVKLISGTSDEILVDAVTSGQDGPVYGIIVYNSRKNSTLPGARRDLFCTDSAMWVLASAPITRGQQVTAIPPTYTGGVQVTDAMVAPATSTAFVCGVALDNAAGAGSMIRIQVKTPTAPIA